MYIYIVVYIYTTIYIFGGLPAMSKTRPPTTMAGTAIPGTKQQLSRCTLHVFGILSCFDAIDVVCL